jgi:lipoprotein-anchoring transpeptidase ErfK/SrfK
MPVATLITLVALTLLLAACNAVAAGSIPTPNALATVTPPATGTPATGTPAVVNASTPVPTTTGTLVSATSPTESVAPGAAIGETPASGAVLSAIQGVIQKANQEEQQALTANDPTLMKDTATIAYYSQLVQGFNDMESSGVTAIKLDSLTWGPITLQGATTARATTVETWSTTFSDGGTLQSTDTNVYMVVLQSGAWVIQSDEFPNTRRMQPPPGTPGTPGTGTGTPGPTSVAPAPVAPVGSVGAGQSQSRNWAGYAATGGTFTAVSGAWTVPNVSTGTTGTTATDATWVGIGGVNTTDLIQVGTQAVVQAGQVVYSAWWETLPQASQYVPLNLSPGDSVSVSITQQPDSTWQIIIRDATSGEVYQHSLSYSSSLSSAEWIEEAPTGRRSVLPLDNFGTITFTNATTLENGQQRTIAQAGGQSITMLNAAGKALAQTSALNAAGTTFGVTRTSVTNLPAPRSVPGGAYAPSKGSSGTAFSMLTDSRTTQAASDTTQPASLRSEAPTQTAPGAQGDAKWIDVSIATQSLRAYEGDKVVFETLVSAGVAAHPTVKGTFHIFQKLVADDMAGGSGASAYFLPAVPYVMYFAEDGYALHGTYWHHNFGHPMSHGCVNLATPDAKWLYNWAPMGTTVIVH